MLYIPIRSKQIFSFLIYLYMILNLFSLIKNSQGAQGSWQKLSMRWWWNFGSENDTTKYIEEAIRRKLFP